MQGWWKFLAAAFALLPFRPAELPFEHNPSKTPRKYLIESVGSGVALLDYDNDGLLDVYLVNAAELKDPMPAGAVPVKSSPRFHNRLYRNLGRGRFEDVTARAGLAGAAYGMGAAAADFDNDGFPDLYVTAFPRNQLFHNNGDGTFTDVTAASKTAASGWSSSAAWLDYDGDGLLDLAVVRYLHWDFEPDLWCGAREPGMRSYCHPDQFRPVSHLLFRNKGDGTFDDVSASSGFGRHPGKGLGIALADYDRDGLTDIAVANDAFPQQLFRNLGGGKFEETGFDAGIAYDDDGRVFSGMGIDFGDYDNDGWPDLIINALASQRYALFHNRNGAFEYQSPASGVAAITRNRSGWGIKFLDASGHGRLDILGAQGHVMDNIQLTQPAVPYLEPLLLMRNLGGGRFADASREAGPAFLEPRASRGAAFGDLDNDGALDAVVNVNGGRALVLWGAPPPDNWLLIDGLPIGAAVRAGNQWRTVSTAGSFLSSNDPRAHFRGLPAEVEIEIRYPGGKSARFTSVRTNRIWKPPAP
jgi:hypothetical protein